MPSPPDQLGRELAGPHADGPAAQPDPLEPLAALLRDLRTTPDGLSGREAARRLVAYGPNELSRRSGLQWPHELPCVNP